MDEKEIVFALLIAISLSAACGLRAFLPLSVISLLGWTGHITLASGFEWLKTPEAALAFTLAAIIEIVADKFPGLDHALDAAGLVVKPAAGALLATGIITGMDPILGASLGVIVGGGIAGMTHALKAQLRLFSTGFTGGLANPVVSTAEDATTVAGITMGLVAPVLAGLTVMALLFWLVRRLMRKRKLEEAVV